MAAPPLDHTATLLIDGTVLVAGGSNCAANSTCFLPDAALFDPASESFLVLPNMLASRTLHTATRLQSGKVLIAGGNNSMGFLAAAELFDPVAGSFQPAGSMAQPRREHTATLLSSGKVLVAGGFVVDDAGNQSLASAELYDTASNTFSSAEPMLNPRTGHTATLLPDGKVLIAGGNVPCTLTQCGAVLNAFSSAELYDPAGNLFSAAGSMSTPRFLHTATALPSGLVVIAGGLTVDAAGARYFPTGAIELYDPATGAFSSGGSLLLPRRSHTATLLPTGQILFTGGVEANGVTRSAELYTPATQTSIPVSDMVLPRALHTATLLENGQVAIIGGSSLSGNGEIFK